jgi:hypothetical protein
MDPFFMSVLSFVWIWVERQTLGGLTTKDEKSNENGSKEAKLQHFSFRNGSGMRAQPP